MKPRCPECGSSKVRATSVVHHKHGTAVYWECRDCRARWQTG